MMQSAAVAQRNADHRLLRRSSRLADRFRHFAGLAVAEASAALAVADHHERRETEALAALHRLRDAVDVDELFDQLCAAVLAAATATPPVVTPAATATATSTATAAAATTATATARTAAFRAIARSRRFDGSRCFGGCLSGSGRFSSGFGRSRSFGGRSFRRRSCFGSGVRCLRGFFFVSHLELQSAFAGSVGEGLHAAMKQE